MQHISNGKKKKKAQNVKTVSAFSFPYQAHKFEALQQLAVLVFQAMSFVDDHAAPVDGVELRTAS